MAFNNSKDANKTLPVCFGYEKTLPGRIPLFKLIQIDSQLKSYEGKVFSIGLTNYCGRMIALGKLPITPTGFQVRVSYNGEAVPSSSSGINSSNSAGVRNREPSTDTGAAQTQTAPAHPLDALKEAETKMAEIFTPLWNSCATLAAKAVENSQRRFLGRMRENMTELGGSMRDTGRRVGEGSGKLVRMARDKLNKDECDGQA